MILYRPVGLKELELIAKAEFKTFPPRLPHQPFFYPVLNFKYPQQIAREWNTKDQNSGFAGFVTKFEVAERYIQQFDVQVVGRHLRHRELWIPAEELETFNRHIIGQITVVAAYYGQKFDGALEPEWNLPLTNHIMLWVPATNHQPWSST